LQKDLIAFALTNYNNLTLLKIWSEQEDRKNNNYFLAFKSEVEKKLSEIKIETTLIADIKNGKESSSKYKNEFRSKTITKSSRNR